MPAPLLKRRLPSGRGATEQPNVSGDGDVPLNTRFWVALVVTGMAAGLLGALMMFVLFNVEHLAFNFQHGTFQAAVERSSNARRITVLLIAGAIGGPAWYVLRRYTKGESSRSTTPSGAARSPRSAGALAPGSSPSSSSGWGHRSAGRRPQVHGGGVRHRHIRLARPHQPLSAGCWWPAAPAPAWAPSTTSRSGEPCSPSRCCSGLPPCRPSSRPWRALLWRR